MYGSRPEPEYLGNVVIGLQFVIVKRLEALDSAGVFTLVSD